MKRYGKASLFALLVCTAAGAIVLGAQLVGWATTACQVPNPSTVFCTDMGGSQYVVDCHSNDGFELTCGSSAEKFQNNFPDGPAESESGTTKEESAECWKTADCEYDSATNKCNVSSSWSEFQPEDKTVIGENECPTEE